MSTNLPFWGRKGFSNAQWRAVYAFVRRAGIETGAAADITQEFLLHCWQQCGASEENPNVRHPRTYYRRSLQHFLCDARRRAAAQKRGGRSVILPLSAVSQIPDASTGVVFDPTSEEDSEKEAGRAVLQAVWSELRDDYRKAGQLERFESIARLLLREPTTLSYRQMAEELGVAAPTVKSLVYRFKQRYQRFLRRRLARATCRRAAIDTEIRHFLHVFLA